MRAKDSEHRIRDAVLLLESLLVCNAAPLKRVPLLRLLLRSVTADLRVLPPEDEVAIGFEVEFRSPYFHIPVRVDKGQVGQVKRGQWLDPGAFRLFDWQTWAHIDGKVEWHGELRTQRKGQQLDLITGFRYRIPELPKGVGTLGLRLAEGVESNVRLACGRSIVPVSFRPVFWLMEPTAQGFRPVPIKSTKLMGLIVPLCEIGSGNPSVAGSAVTTLRHWVEHNLGSNKPFTRARELLRYLRDWSPLGMEPLYPGLLDLFEQLQVTDLERELFDFVADNWGVRGNRNGRLLAVRLLGALHTESAGSALQAIYELVRHGGIARDELDLIRSIAERGKGTDSAGPAASERG